MNIKEYIASGIIEAYVMGSASETETHELLYLKAHYPQIEEALEEVENDMERIAQYMAVPPPPNIWERIEDSLNELVVTPEYEPLQKSHRFEQDGHDFKRANSQQFIEVEAESSHIRVHKTWKWVFAAVFILSKIFLICSIYFYLENRQAQQQIQQLKTELKQQQNP
jgi:hypothetical protein